MPNKLEIFCKSFKRPNRTSIHVLLRWVDTAVVVAAVAVVAMAVAVTGVDEEATQVATMHLLDETDGRRRHVIY